MEVLEAAEKQLASYILKENASKEKENRKPKAFRHTGEWRRFHRGCCDYLEISDILRER